MRCLTRHADRPFETKDKNFALWSQSLGNYFAEVVPDGRFLFTTWAACVFPMALWLTKSPSTDPVSCGPYTVSSAVCAQNFSRSAMDRPDLSSVLQLDMEHRMQAISTFVNDEVSGLDDVYDYLLNPMVTPHQISSPLLRRLGCRSCMVQY